MNRNLTPEQRLVRARTQLLLNQPFFGTLAVRLKLLPGELPTMATDGRRIVYNPQFVQQLKPAELEGVVAHEVMHCALAHHCRRGNRNPQVWNQAADYAVNPLLLSAGMTLPAGVLVNPEFANLSAEEIYARLSQQASGSMPDQPPTSPSPGSSPGRSPAPADQPADAGPPTHPPGVGEVLDAVDEDGKPASHASLERQKREWAIATEQALRSAQACGREPAGIERTLNEARESAIDWRSVLRDFIAATRPSDYRWTPPNRRFVSRGLYLPSVERSGAGEMVIVVDTSGSIGSVELDQFAGEINAIAVDVEPERVHVVYCDAAVQGVEEFEQGELVLLHPAGGGGTDFRPAFEWVSEKGIDPKCLIYLTDLCCRSYPHDVDYPVLWVTDSHRTAPIGQTVRITPE